MPGVLLTPDAGGPASPAIRGFHWAWFNDRPSSPPYTTRGIPSVSTATTRTIRPKLLKTELSFETVPGALMEAIEGGFWEWGRDTFPGVRTVPVCIIDHVVIVFLPRGGARTLVPHTPLVLRH